MASTVESINKPIEEELMISIDDIQFKLTSLKMMTQSHETLDITSLMMTSQAIENLSALIKNLCKEKSNRPEVLMPLVDKASISTTWTEDDEAVDADVFGKDKVLTYKDLQLLSNDFSSDNFMGKTQYGELYKGYIPKGWKGLRSGEVTIKMWRNKRFVSELRSAPEDPNRVRFRMDQEIKFLQQPDIALHPYTVNVMGYCFEEDKLGVVYDLKPLQTLQKYIDNDNFGWLKRVGTAMKLAHLLKFFHENEPQYIVRNLCPAHVMLDQDLNPVLIDYAMINGGSFVEAWKAFSGPPFGICGYKYIEELNIGSYTACNDVHAYGVILLEILRRWTNMAEVLSRVKPYAWHDYYLHKKAVQGKYGIKKLINCILRKEKVIYSFVHECLRSDPDYDVLDGNTISLLELKCVEAYHIPTIDEVMKELEKLKLVSSHPELLLG